MPPLSRAVLEERLAKTQAAQAKQRAFVDELVRQINVLIGREAELTELLALLEAGPEPPETPA